MIYGGVSFFFSFVLGLRDTNVPSVWLLLLRVSGVRMCQDDRF